jgi:hypothetical protein
VSAIKLSINVESSPLLQLILNGATPPLIVMSIDPSLPPLHDILNALFLFVE